MQVLENSLANADKAPRLSVLIPYYKDNPARVTGRLGKKHGHRNFAV